MTIEKIFELLKKGVDLNMVVYDNLAHPYVLTPELIFHLDRHFEKEFNKPIYNFNSYIYMEKVYLFYENMPRVDRRIVQHFLPDLEIIYLPTTRVITTYEEDLQATFPENDHVIIMGYNEKYDKVMLGSY